MSQVFDFNNIVTQVDTERQQMLQYYLKWHQFNDGFPGRLSFQPLMQKEIEDLNFRDKRS